MLSKLEQKRLSYHQQIRVKNKSRQQRRQCFLKQCKGLIQNNMEQDVQWIIKCLENKEYYVFQEVGKGERNRKVMRMVLEIGEKEKEKKRGRGGMEKYLEIVKEMIQNKRFGIIEEMKKEDYKELIEMVFGDGGEELGDEKTSKRRVKIGCQIFSLLFKSLPQQVVLMLSSVLDKDDMELSQEYINLLYLMRNSSLIKSQSLKRRLIIQKLSLSQSSNTHLQIIQILKNNITPIFPQTIFTLFTQFSKILNSKTSSYVIKTQIYYFLTSLLLQSPSFSFHLIAHSPLITTILSSYLSPYKSKSIHLLSTLIIHSQNPYTILTSYPLLLQTFNDCLRQQNIYLIIDTLLAFQTIIPFSKNIVINKRALQKLVLEHKNEEIVTRSRYILEFLVNQ